MDISKGMEKMYANGQYGLHNTLGMEFYSTPDPNSIEGRMPVDERHIQPFKFLNGGASLAFAETVAGLGSYALEPDKVSMGMSVSSNHVRPAKLGETLTAVATIVHRGHSSHVWRVDIKNQEGKIVNISTVTNSIIEVK